MKKGLLIMMMSVAMMATAQTQVEIKLNQVGYYPLEQKTVVVEGADPTGKITIEDSEGIHAQVKVANYGEESLAGKRITWTLGDKQGEMTIANDGYGLIGAGALDIDLSNYHNATKLILTLAIEGKAEPNSYELWVYPAEDNLEALKKSVIIANSLTPDVTHRLQEGESVLLMPGESELTVGGLFTTDYWNYRMFKTISENNKRHVSPGTLGILTDPAHPLFASFPTDAHTNWQWFPVIKASNPFKLDNISPYNAEEYN